jgi:hypothetical protein
VNIRDFQDSLEYLFQAQLTGFIWGHAGIGKSSIIKQYAERKGYHFFPLYLGTQSDLGDVLGLADFVRDKNGTAVATTFATPVWLKDAIDYCNNNPNSGAIIFLDEFNRARRDVLNGMFSLALDKTFHTIKLPKNCHVIAAGNPPTDEYYVTDVNETALMARFVHVKLEPTVNEWVEYAVAAKTEPTLVSFIQEQPTLLEDAKSDFQLPIKVDRRSYGRLNELFKIKTPVHLLTQLMHGIIGVERSVAYDLHVKNSEKPLTGDEVLDGKGLDRVASWQIGEHTKTSLVAATSDNVMLKLTELDAANTLMSASQKANLMAYILAIPKDIAFTMIDKAAKGDNKAFRDMAMQAKNAPVDETRVKYQSQLIDIVKVAKKAQNESKLQ